MSDCAQHRARRDGGPHASWPQLYTIAGTSEHPQASLAFRDANFHYPTPTATHRRCRGRVHSGALTSSWKPQFLALVTDPVPPVHSPPSPSILPEGSAASSIPLPTVRSPSSPLPFGHGRHGRFCHWRCPPRQPRAAMAATRPCGGVASPPADASHPSSPPPPSV